MQYFAMMICHSPICLIGGPCAHDFLFPVYHEIHERLSSKLNFQPREIYIYIGHAIINPYESLHFSQRSIAHRMPE